MRQPNNCRGTPIQPGESPARQHPEDAPQNRMQSDESIMRLTLRRRAVRNNTLTIHYAEPALHDAPTNNTYLIRSSVARCVHLPTATQCANANAFVLLKLRWAPRRRRALVPAFSQGARLTELSFAVTKIARASRAALLIKRSRHAEVFANMS